MKILLTLIIILCFIAGYSQVEKTGYVDSIKTIGQVKNSLGKPMAILVFNTYSKDTLYVLKFKNDAYQHIEDWQYLSFYERGNSLNSLYTILKEQLRKEKDSKQTIKVGEEDILIQTFEAFGQKGVWISKLNGNVYFQLYNKWLDDLFAKPN